MMLRRILTTLVVLATTTTTTLAIDNGLGRTPPMGWRSWNAYHNHINQEMMTAAADAMVDKSRGLSLLDVGFNNCGLDDYYQDCHTGAAGSFHNASGYPLIDTTKFPSMKAMTDHAHAIGLRMGWYGNNCGCNEHQNVASWGPPATAGQTDGIKHYQGDIQATIDFGFDGLKLDDCGEFKNLTYYAELMNATGKPILIEDCHWGKDGPGSWGDGGKLNQGPNEVPPEKWCPFNFFRTSGDIGSSWGKVFGNLQSVIKHQPWGNSSAVRTGPGCWAYPDMLEVGNLATFEEDRSHFGAWCIVSAPLILGHDLTKNATNDLIWPIVTNKDAISVSQSFAEGDRMHPGGLVRSFNPFGPPPPPSPSPHPHPPPPPSPPCPPPVPVPSSALYMWAEDAGTAGKAAEWSVPSTGGAAGQIKHVPSNTCVDASVGGGCPGKQGTEVMLAPCAATATALQTFTFDADTGNLRLAGHSRKGTCLAVYNWDGPQILWWGCNKGVNEEFVFSAAGSLCSKNGTGTGTGTGKKAHRSHCLTANSTSPPKLDAHVSSSSDGSGEVVGQGGTSGSGAVAQLWAKPQPDGATAVLVINNGNPGTPNMTAQITFAEVRYTPPASATTTVLDIWTGKTVELPAGTRSFNTTSFGSHDSAFYLFSPGQ